MYNQFLSQYFLVTNFKGQPICYLERKQIKEGFINQKVLSRGKIKTLVACLKIQFAADVTFVLLNAVLPLLAELHKVVGGHQF